MTDRLSLTHALTAANIDRAAAERIATIIVRIIGNSAGAAPDLAAREQRIADAFARAGVAALAARHIAAEIIALVRQKHPPHG